MQIRLHMIQPLLVSRLTRSGEHYLPLAQLSAERKDIIKVLCQLCARAQASYVGFAGSESERERVSESLEYLSKNAHAVHLPECAHKDADAGGALSYKKRLGISRESVFSRDGWHPLQGA